MYEAPNWVCNLTLWNTYTEGLQIEKQTEQVVYCTTSAL